MSRTEKPDEDPWKTEVEKVYRNPAKASGGTTKGGSATTGRYVTRATSKRNPGTTGSSKSGRSEKKGIEKVATGNDGNRHVVPNTERGGWDVVKENHERSSGHYDTQKEAEARARQIVDKTSRGNGEVITHGRDGRIRDSDSGRRNETRAKDTK
ncbi:hypothetical protein BH09ACT3_BH09ACT3_08610 [soil metagenome]